MSDIYPKSKRSDIMSKITGKETVPEILVRKFLFSKGLRFRKNVKGLPGKPDIVLPKYKTAVFIHGCFWHGHSCKRGALPKTNYEFWQEKIGKNIERDVRHISELQVSGWNVIIVWQCEIQNKEDRNTRLNKLIEEIHQAHNIFPIT
ncbi:DNA mismatch endonuclease Vsr [Alistipes sp. dk3620]|uniref:very short patch repair endonuclease n=1 Tax=unclassified Alistipes TaxID=2608932 RepID=UPI001295F396|nr:MULTISPECIES: DNA mismatch endonuclease Vsr [unclassified Alistipes]MQX26760.1 DNA mismatch endonuclease Vsr [Alistipes sp. dk3620]QGA24153.1 DNA mismatch endonuclease Vsr [Alistipes sp. dk3624]